MSRSCLILLLLSVDPIVDAMIDGQFKSDHDLKANEVLEICIAYLRASVPAAKIQDAAEGHVATLRNNRGRVRWLMAQAEGISELEAKSKGAYASDPFQSQTQEVGMETPREGGDQARFVFLSFLFLILLLVFRTMTRTLVLLLPGRPTHLVAAHHDSTP